MSKGVIGVVSGRHSVSTQVFKSELLEAVEFDVLVAQQVWIRRPAFRVLFEQVREDAVPVLLDKVDLVKGDLQFFANPFSILGVSDAVTRSGFFFIVPILHVHPVHFKACNAKVQNN